MALPNLDYRGLLPEGIHDSSFPEIVQRFCNNGHRQALWSRCYLFFTAALLPILNGHELILAGSFFSDKALPDDIEATVVIPEIHIGNMELLRLSVARANIKKDYGVDYVPTIRYPGHNDFTLYFQYVGPKTAAAKKLSPNDKRGIVRVKI